MKHTSTAVDTLYALTLLLSMIAKLDLGLLSVLKDDTTSLKMS